MCSSYVFAFRYVIVDVVEIEQHMEELETKNVGVAITDETDGKLDKIMEAKKFKNRADAVEWLIQETFKLLFKGGS